MRTLALAALALIQFVSGAYAWAQTDKPLENQLNAIEAEVSALRGLEALGDTDWEFITREDVAGRFEQYVAEHPVPTGAVDPYLFYRALDLAEPGLNLDALVLQYWSIRAAGFYDFHSNTMYVVVPDKTATLQSLEKSIYAHEFTHALQDQHFDLAALNKRLINSNNMDLRIARTALLEGDASFVRQKYLEKLRKQDALGTQRALDQERSLAEASQPPPDLPQIILEEEEFVYFEGMRFVVDVFYSEGWDAINRGLSNNPPQTSEQILHPERYLAGEGALPVKMPDHSSLTDDGWQPAYDSAVGEFYLRQHLETQHSAGATQLAAGWGGDRLRIFAKGEDADMIWVWYLVWDNELEAAEFSQGYRHFLDQRYAAESTDGQCWSSETTHCFARTSATETRITFAPDRESAHALLDLLD